MSIKTLAACLVVISLCGACKGRGESKPYDTDSTETSGALYVPDTCAATGAPFSAESPATVPLDSLVGGIPHNRMVKGRKHGIWIEVDSMSGNTSIVRYDRGRIDGQYLWYATLNPHDFGIASALLMFYEKDMANLLSLDKDRNVLRGISDSIKRNVDFVKEAREFGFTGVGRQSVTYGFDDYGNLTDIEHYIYNPERGDDFIVDPFDVGEVQSFKHPEEEELWRDIRKKVERGELKRGCCEWTRKLVGERIPHNYYVGSKTGEGWRIFDYYGGKDFRTQSVRAGVE